MKQRICLAVLMAVCAHGGLAQPPRVPVLVELFTSEGCSSCPPADALLASLDRDQPVEGAQVIAIGLHVDYFNQLGWKDAFSSGSFTARQQNYSGIFGPDSMYTPQIVVDGREAVIGSERDAVFAAIRSAARRDHLPVHITAQGSGGSVRLAMDLPAAPRNAEKIQVFAAITEDGLSSLVSRGENRGRTLHHAAVARTVKGIGFLIGNSSSLAGQIEIERSWRPASLTAVVWLQGLKSRRVYGTAVARVAA
jgi:hypothetical protein